MDSHNGSQEASLLNLPIEQIRNIVHSLDDPQSLVNFVCTCKGVNNALDLAEWLKVDLVRQRLHEPTNDLDELHRPLLLWAIETGRDIGYIQTCIEFYQRNLPGGIEGRYYPRHQRLYRRFPSPMYAATKAGRLDVIKALLASGVGLEAGPQDSSADYWLATGHYFEQEAVKDMYRVACETQREDIAMFFISQGLGRNYWDLWLAARAGFFQVVDTLLENMQSIHGDDADITLAATLRHAVEHPVANQEIILPIMHARTHPAFNAVRFLEVFILSTLAKIGWPDFVYYSSSEDSEDVSSEYEIGLNSETAKEARTWREGAIQAVHLCNIYAMIADEPFDVTEFATHAVREDEGLDVLKTVLSGHHPWVIGNSESKRSETLNELLRIAVEHGAIENARFLATTFGLKYSAVCLDLAMQEGDCELIDEIMQSGLSPNCAMPGDRGPNPLSVALGYGRSGFEMACRLLHYGASTRKIGRTYREELYSALWKMPKEYREALRDLNSPDGPQVRLSRDVFALLLDIDMDSLPVPEYILVVHTMTSLILGSYWEDFQIWILTMYGVYNY
ncbi:hypothetical protein F4805DRAFT_478429 [Annulohypoxylon moriforme]|nr:hypothetical protein F4805DRAFT_478429 [Annulohypoxylon moriforme]